MKFYFNYFLLIGREHINCLLSTVHICKCLFPEKGGLLSLERLTSRKNKKCCMER